MLTIVVESLSGAPNNAITFYSINISWVRRLFSLLNPVHCALKGSQLPLEFLWIPLIVESWVVFYKYNGLKITLLLGADTYFLPL